MLQGVLMFAKIATKNFVFALFLLPLCYKRNAYFDTNN